MGVNKLFLSVGAMKAGTTFLFNVLEKHPEIYFTPEKELHYFANTANLSWRLQRPLSNKILYTGIMKNKVLTNDFRRHRLSSVMHNRFSRISDANQVRSIVTWYADRYLTNPVDIEWFDRVYSDAGNNWAADFSNYNALLSKKGWEFVRAHCDRLKVMYVMRDPVERIWSHMKFEYLHTDKREKLIGGDTVLIDHFMNSMSSSHARYNDVVNSLQSNLSEEELIVLKLENVVSDLQGQMDKVTDFLEVERFVDINVNSMTKANKTEDIIIPKHAREHIEAYLKKQSDIYYVV